MKLYPAAAAALFLGIALLCAQATVEHDERE
jgi:hypothetical protein